MNNIHYLASYLHRTGFLRTGIIFARTKLTGSTSVSKRWKHIEKTDIDDKPVKFTTSEAHVDYKATLNFYGDTIDRPDSHNAVLAFSFIFGFFYLIFLRDDVDEGGALSLLQPVHETVPSMAIPLLQSAIAENKKFGHSTKKLEEKLAEYMKTPEKYGGEGRKMAKN